MPDDTAAYHELIRVLEQAVQAGVTSIGIEWKDRELMVFPQAGPLGLGAGRIAEEMQAAVIEELVDRAGLGRKSKGRFQATLLGREFEVVVEEYDSFGESAFNLTIRESRSKANR